MRAVARTARCWGPLVVGFLCLIAASFVGPTVAWILMILALGLIFDGAATMWVRACGAGNLTTHRQ